MEDQDNSESQELPVVPTSAAAPVEEVTPDRAKISNFFKMQKKNPKLYKISPTGLLQTFTKDGSIVDSIELLNYRALYPEEREAMEKERHDSLAALDLQFEAARKELYQAFATYKQTGESAPVVVANVKVHEIEQQRVLIRSAMRGIKLYPVPTANQILFDEPYETRKLFGNYNTFDKDPLKKNIYVLERMNFPPVKAYGRYEKGVSEVVEISPQAEGGILRLTTGVPVRLFYESDDPINGFLSPLLVADFVYKTTQYSSAFQAFEAERAVEAGQPEIKTAILKTRSSRTIRVVTRKVKQPVKNLQATWTGILTALYQQHPELVTKLLETGQDMLVYADPEKGGGGVGLGTKDKKILDPTQWQSDNVVGKVLEGLRVKFKESAVAEAPAEEAKEKVVTEEQQKEKKRGIIIQRKR